MKQKKKDYRIIQIGKRIQELRKKKGYANYENFASDHGIARGLYGRWEKGQNMELLSWFRVLEALEVNFIEFFDPHFSYKNNLKKNRLRPDLKEVGNKIRNLRKKAGYSSYERFVHENNLSRGHYSRVENGANIRLLSLLKILDVFDISLKDFFNNNFSNEKDYPETHKRKNTDPRLAFIGKKFRALRKEKGYTSYESFAWDHGINRMQYWRMETGENFTFLSFIKVLDALEIPLEDFFKSGITA